jgi:hypothetical protein
MTLRFEWDEKKRLNNIHKHGIERLYANTPILIYSMVYNIYFLPQHICLVFIGFL